MGGLVNSCVANNRVFSRVPMVLRRLLYFRVISMYSTSARQLTHLTIRRGEGMIEIVFEEGM